MSSTPTIVNFTAEDSGTATLVRAIPKVDANAEGTHQWDIDLVAGVDEDGADHVAPMLPEVGEYLARARDGQGSAQITIQPTDRDLRLTLRTTDGEVVLEDVAAEIRYLRMHLTEKVQNYVARLRLHSLDPEASARLVMALAKPLQITAVPMQQSFDFEAPLGAIVTAQHQGRDVYGVLKKRTDAGLVVHDFGVVYTVATINVAITLTDGYESFVDDYAEAVKAAGGNPTWHDLLRAMAEVGDGATIDKQVVDHALGGHTPAEAGSGG